jgi:hypothetical protein
MRDYWLTQELLQAVGIGFLLLALIGIGLALWLPKRWWGKLLAVLAVGVLIGMPMWQSTKESEQLHAEVDLARERYAEAQALFEARCKTTGEKIYKTVENVEGVFVIKPRTEDINFNKQFKLDDPYGYAGKGEDYLRLFIRGRSTIPTKIGEIVPSNQIVSYRYVEVANETGNGFYRYTTSMNKDDSESLTRNGGGVVPLSRTSMSTRSARYGITWDDISTQEDRESWIAGSSQKIIDMQTNEVIAERVGYMFDRGLGDTSGGRSPWSFARDNACPPLNEKTFYFFDRIIKPVQDAKK